MSAGSISKQPLGPKPGRARAWLVGGVVFLSVLWLMRPTRPQFLRLPARGPAPAWEFKDLDGHSHASTNFAGQIVVLNFWATWCPPCLRELPELAAFHRAHTNAGVTVIGASIDDPPEPALRSFLQRSPPPYPVFVADALSRDAFGGVSQIPETWVIGRNGQVVARYLGPIHREELDRAIAPLLAAPGTGSGAPP